MGKYNFDEESIYKISKPYLKFVTYGRTDTLMEGQTSPKQYAPLTFSKLVAKLILLLSQHFTNDCFYSNQPDLDHIVAD